MPIISDSSPSYGPTFEQLITEIVTSAQGFAVAPDRMVTLTTDMTETSTSLSLDTQVSPGVFEIGDELILVTAAADKDCTVHPRGRGWQGTLAVTHSAGDVVTEGPVFPRARCAQLINDVIQGLFPTVFGVGQIQGPMSGVMFEVPVDAELILDVRTLVDDEWVRVRTWEPEMQSNAAMTGKVIRIPGIPEGQIVQVVFGTRPEALTDNDQRWSDTGLGSGLKDAVVAGVLARFARNLDLGRLSDRFVTPQGDSQQPQLGAGFAMARQLDADFKASLDREATALRNAYPARAHFVR